MISVSMLMTPEQKLFFSKLYFPLGILINSFFILKLILSPAANPLILIKLSKELLTIISTSK